MKTLSRIISIFDHRHNLTYDLDTPTIMSLSESCPPFFIVGAQRSGTTLLRLVLNSHSQIAIPEEARFLTPFLKSDYANKPLTEKQLENAIKYLSLNPQYQLWNYDREPVLTSLSKNKEVALHDLINRLYSSYAAHEGKTFWGDKSLFYRHVDILANLFPTSKFIHIVRDGRDVFHSWRKMDPTKNNVASSALDWNYKIFCINRSFSKLPDDRKITVRYEDLLVNPAEITNNICTFLGIPFEENMLDFHKTSHYYIGRHHSDLIFRSIDSDNMYKWKKNLSSIEIRSFELISGYNLVKYGYGLSGTRKLFIDPFYILAKLIVGVPFRTYHVMLNKYYSSSALKHGRASGVDAGKMPEPKKDS